MKLTRKEIAEKTGIPVSSWGTYEEGRAFPNHKKLPVICDVLQYWDIYSLLTMDLSLLEQNPDEVSPKMVVQAYQVIGKGLKKLLSQK